MENTFLINNKHIYSKRAAILTVFITILVGLFLKQQDPSEVTLAELAQRINLILGVFFFFLFTLLNYYFKNQFIVIKVDRILLKNMPTQADYFNGLHGEKILHILDLSSIKYNTISDSIDFITKKDKISIPVNKDNPVVNEVVTWFEKHNRG